MPSASEFFVRASRNIYVLDANYGSPNDIDPHSRLSEQGACAGFCHTWLAAFIHNVPQATHLPGFDAYMRDFLRYQAYYLQDNIEAAPGGTQERGWLNDPATSSLLMDLLHLTNSAFQSRLRTLQITSATIEDFQARFVPIIARRPAFATMVGFCAHVIAIARRDGGLYIFDPNLGLALYDNPTSFSFDMVELINLYITRDRLRRRDVVIFDMHMTPAASII
jgi:hypothetical protein